MRLSIRWKLFISITFPLLLVYLVVLFIQYRQLSRAAHQRVNAMLTALAERNAAKLDGELRSAAQVARSSASFITLNPGLSTDQIYQILRGNVAENPGVYGACVAFAPSAVPRPDNRLAPYVCRDGATLRTIDIKDSYDYVNWDWFKLPMQSGKGMWTEPYFDKGAGNAVMCTYSIPFIRNSARAGVATVDIQLDELQHRIFNGESSNVQFVVLSANGNFISHPDRKMILQKGAHEMARQSNSASLTNVVEFMVRGEHDIKLAGGFDNSGPNWIAFAPIRSANWSLAASVPESMVTAELYPQLAMNVIAMLGGLVLIIGTVLVGSVRITRPIMRLAEGVRQVSAGNLNVRIHESRERDEIRDLAKAFNRMVRDLSSHVEALKNETAAREAVEGEMRVARKIQQSLLPSSFPPFPSREEFDLHAVNLAAKQVAGDFFDFFLIEDEHLLFVIADVSGKGVPAALLMAVTRTILRNLATSDFSPADILSRTSEILSKDNTDGTMFVTAFIALYHVPSGKITYANAGHPPPYRISASGEITVFGEVTGTVIGVDLAEPHPIEERSEVLNVGERLVLFTDGVTEARSESGAFFGEERFQKFLAAHAREPIRNLCAVAADTLQDFQAGNLKDDLTLLVLARNA